jgi:alkanesulfonate monooxygenase SsuD/methylene tetrahydromethanopterin reductase-like flavin-dependent oxidoreductase (luciferase family)
VWAVDHLIGFPRPEDGILEAWTVMSALAAATSRISIGAQVLCQSFRSPALLAKMATTLDLISGDRLRFLVGAGWLEAEYRAFGYPFPPAGDRVAQLEDTVRICRGMFDAGTEAFSYQGRAHSVSDVTNVPAPNRRIPIGIGAVGDRMLDLVARFGDEWNVPAMVLNSYPGRRSVLEGRLGAHGRDVKRSAQVVFNPGNRDLPGWYSMFKPELGLCGSESQMADRAGELAELGITGFYGFVADDKSLDDLADALPALRATVTS